MFASRQAIRNAPRFAAQVRAGAQRRFASSATENEFIKERQHIKDHAKGTTELWRKISVYGVAPCLIAAGANAYYLWNEHWEHWSHMPALEDRTEYAYQNIRTKNFQWGNGDKTLLFFEMSLRRRNITYDLLSTKLLNDRINEEANKINSWNDKVNYHNKDKVA